MLEDLNSLYKAKESRVVKEKGLQRRRILERCAEKVLELGGGEMKEEEGLKEEVYLDDIEEEF